MKRSHIIIAVSVISVLLLIVGLALVGDDKHAIESRADTIPAAQGSADNSQVWAKRCEKPDDGQDICEVYQSVFIPQGDQSVKLADVVFAKLNNRKQFVVTLPLGIMLAEGLSFQFDEGEIMTMPFQKCHAIGCVAYTALTDAIYKDVKKARKMHITFWDGAQNSVKLTLDMNGLNKIFGTL